MAGIEKHHGDVTEALLFDHVKENFTNAARYGLKAQFHWVGGEVISASKLILERLLPQAADGLLQSGFSDQEVDRYLSVIEERVKGGRTGSQWVLDSIDAMKGQGTTDSRCRALTEAMIRNQEAGGPIHTWPTLDHLSTKDWRDDYRTVSQVMVRDLFTVHPEDLVDLAASVMDWEHLRHVPVESEDGELMGLITSRHLLRLMGKGNTAEVAVQDIMLKDPIHVSPEMGILDAMHLMRDKRLACLPVTKDGKLIGLVTEADFLTVAARLFEDQFQETDAGKAKD